MEAAVSFKNEYQSTKTYCVSFKKAVIWMLIYEYLTTSNAAHFSSSGKLKEITAYKI